MVPTTTKNPIDMAYNGETTGKMVMARIGEFDAEVNHCPYCGSENIEWMGDAFEDEGEEVTPWHCHHCDTWFGIASK